MREENDAIQEERKRMDKRVDDLLSSGVWVIAQYPGVRLLGKVVECHFQNAKEDDITKTTVICALYLRGVLGMNPAYEYIIQVGQTPTGGIAKQPMMLPFDMASKNILTYVAPQHVTFLSDAQEDDLKMYKGLIGNAIITQDSTEVTDGKKVDGPRIIPATGPIPPSLRPVHTPRR